MKIDVWVQMGLLLVQVVTLVYLGIQTDSLVKQQEPNLYVQAFLGDTRFFRSEENQNVIPDASSIPEFNGQQLVVVVSNTGGVPATITRVQSRSGERAITVNNMVIPLTIKPFEAKYFNITDPAITRDVSSLTLFGFNRKRESWLVPKENIHIQSPDDPYTSIQTH